MKHLFNTAFPRKMLSDAEVNELNVIMGWEGSGWDFWEQGKTNTMNLEDCALHIDEIIDKCEKEIKSLKEHLELYLEDSDIWEYTSPNRIKSLIDTPLTRDEVSELISEYNTTRCDFIERFYELEETFFGEPIFFSDNQEKHVIKRHKRCSESS